MRSEAELLQAEADFTKAWREYQKAVFGNYLLAILIAITAVLFMGAAVQMERQERLNAQINQEARNG